MKNIDIYFESLKQVYDQISEWEPEPPSFMARALNFLFGTSVVILVLSVLPIIPLILVLLRNIIPISVGPIDTTEGTFAVFGMLWLVGLILSVVLFVPLNWINNKVEARFSKEESRPDQSLSSEQMAFVSAYQAFRELKIYFVSHVDLHVDNCYRALRKLLPPRIRGIPSVALQREFIAGSPRTAAQAARYYEQVAMMESIEYQRRGSGHLPASHLSSVISNAELFLRSFEKQDWLEIDPHLLATLRGFVSLRTKLRHRLRTREDLPEILSILDHLSCFLYAYLPEHKTYLDHAELAKLHDEGRKRLEKLTVEVNELPSYSIPPKKPSIHDAIEKPSIWRRIKGGYFNNIFIRFFLWFVLIVALSSATLYLINMKYPLSPDTMATVIVGAGITGAAALAVFLQSRQPVEQEQSDSES